MTGSIKENISQNLNVCSEPSQLKITDIRVGNINGAPKHCPLIKNLHKSGHCGLRRGARRFKRYICSYVKIAHCGGKIHAMSTSCSDVLSSSAVTATGRRCVRNRNSFVGHCRKGGAPAWQMLGGKFRDKVRMYCDTDVDGKHTGTDMGHALKKRIEQGFTF